MPRLHFVRHGESSWNVEGRVQGQTMDVPLTALGLAQARAAAAALAAEVPAGAVVLSSDQRRAWQTAEIVAARLGTQPIAEPRLREQSLGALEGRLFAELEAQPTPPGLDVSEVRWAEGAESVRDVHGRLGSLLAEVGAMPVDDVVLVSHGDAIRVALAVVAGRGHRDVEWADVPNAAVITR